MPKIPDQPQITTEVAPDYTIARIEIRGTAFGKVDGVGVILPNLLIDVGMGKETNIQDPYRPEDGVFLTDVWQPATVFNSDVSKATGKIAAAVVAGLITVQEAQAVNVSIVTANDAIRTAAYELVTLLDKIAGLDTETGRIPIVVRNQVG